ncbi:MAG TPA: glycosyltransferase family 4 protein [Planctomycetota bacterium]
MTACMETSRRHLPIVVPLEGPTTAVLAPRYPASSETFVYRDVRGLRRAGLDVVVVALRGNPDRVDDPDGPIQPAELVVYDGAGLAAAAAELLARPMRSLLTLGRALADMIAPGEPVDAADRAKLPIQALYALGLARRLRARGVERLHAHFAHAPATVGLYAAEHLRIPFSFTGHANDLFLRRSLLARKLRRAAFVACISEWHRELYASVAPAEKSRRPVVRCGVDTRAWAPPRDRAAGSLLFVGRLVEKKGLDTLLRALARPGASRLRLRVVGDGPMRDAWTALALETGVAARVEWLGARGNADVRRELRRAEALVLPCRTDRAGDRDGIPVVLMEAMACGVPVVAGDLPAIRELVEDGVTGRLVAGGDVDALARALADLAADPEERERLARGGRARVEAEFSMEANAARLAKALREATAP